MVTHPVAITAHRVERGTSESIREWRAIGARRFLLTRNSASSASRHPPSRRLSRRRVSSSWTPASSPPRAERRARAAKARLEPPRPRPRRRATSSSFFSADGWALGAAASSSSPSRARARGAPRASEHGVLLRLARPPRRVRVRVGVRHVALDDRVRLVRVDPGGVRRRYDPGRTAPRARRVSPAGARASRRDDVQALEQVHHHLRHVVGQPASDRVDRGLFRGDALRQRAVQSNHARGLDEHQPSAGGDAHHARAPAPAASPPARTGLAIMVDPRMLCNARRSFASAADLCERARRSSGEAPSLNPPWSSTARADLLPQPRRRRRTACCATPPRGAGARARGARVLLDALHRFH